MEKEFSDKSPEDAVESEEKKASFKGNEEVFTYSGYDEVDVVVDDVAETDAVEERSASYGDNIIEELSAENNVSRVAKFTKMPAHIATYLVAAVYLVVGVICLAITRQVTEVLPYIVGGMMILIGGFQFVLALIKHEYRQVKTNRTATSLIVLALGVMIVAETFDPENDPVLLIAVVWGILGLFEAAHAFNHAFHRIANSERCVYFLIKGIIECAVAFMMLYKPESEAAHHFHIIVFGVNLIFDAVTMIPQVKAFLSK